MYSIRYSCRILIKLEISSQIFEKKKAQISSFIKILPVGAELFQPNGQTDMTTIIVVFRNFENAPKNPKILIRMLLRPKPEEVLILLATKLIQCGYLD